MVATRYTVRLRYRDRVRVQEDTNLDLDNTPVLRATLERLVLQSRHTLDLDLSEWSLTVTRVGGGPIIKRVTVTSGGLTEVANR